jgi:hypothetical protein
MEPSSGTEEELEMISGTEEELEIIPINPPPPEVGSSRNTAAQVHGYIVNLRKLLPLICAVA